jgi:hypothetical protein
VSVSGGGISMQSAIVRTGSAPIGLSETLPAAKTGTLTTRTDNTDGELTMSASPGITTGATIDLYWDGGSRYGVTVGTVATNAVPISGGAGDNLPIATTSITATLRTTANLYIDGDNVKLIAFELQTNDKSLRTAGRITFFDAEDDAIAQLDLVANTPQVFDFEGGATNILTGDPITYLAMSTAGSSATENYSLKISGVYDASP